MPSQTQQAAKTWWCVEFHVKVETEDAAGSSTSPTPTTYIWSPHALQDKGVRPPGGLPDKSCHDGMPTAIPGRAMPPEQLLDPALSSWLTTAPAPGLAAASLLMNVARTNICHSHSDERSPTLTPGP
ncbi:hypothetical protein MAPG_10582 [Magnaporthiopsis poae ATCC 64411]|uniref:Uncharacterized protein n=1 Tax=Magnaporthiopsis poae (strain ATCC 64411 / 73-15) TaxID=644358 RepID=A0A0C4ECZ3_MAGP6|nr:hypothetical protein MAPG_10582 [Magnaporthiopsis poae ATCC 64411]